MKYLSLILLSVICQIVMAQTTPAQPAIPAVPATPAIPAEIAAPPTTIEWLESEFEFGTIKQGDKVEHVFKFKNTGNKPLIISNAKGSCGCTVPEYSKEPLAPGKVGEMKVVFNSAGKMGAQTKPVTITANTEPRETRITLKGMVEPPAGAPAPPSNTTAQPADHAHPHPHPHPHTEATPAASSAQKVVGKTAAKTAVKTTPKPNKAEVANAATKAVKTSNAANGAAKMSKDAANAAKVAKKAAKAAEKAAKKAAKAAEKAAKAVKTVDVR